MSDKKKEEVKKEVLALQITPEKAVPLLQEIMVVLSAIMSMHNEMKADIERKDVRKFLGSFQSMAHGLPVTLKEVFLKYGASAFEDPDHDGTAKLETRLVDKLVAKGTTTLH